MNKQTRIKLDFEPLTIEAEQDYCEICYVNTISAHGPIKDSDTMTVELDCKHRFCHECTLSQLKQLIESAQVQNIACLDYSCKKEIGQDSIKKICGNEIALYAKYERFKDKKALEADPLVRWCPKAKCEMHMRAADKDVKKL